MKRKQAFTLVELIVVITILAILGTISFLSFQGYSRDARDSVRISDLNNISRGMEFMLTKTGRLPVPEDSVEITASGTIISYQGYAGENVLSSIGVNNGGKDPKDDEFYTYVSNANYNKYQILGFLENGDQIGLSELNQVNADLSERFPVTEGYELGIFTEDLTNEPLQNLGTGLDLINATGSFTAVINSFATITGTGSELFKIESIINNGTTGSCKDLLGIRNNLKNKDGFYTVKLGGSYISVYCDMTTQGGGWTYILGGSNNEYLIGKENYDTLLKNQYSQNETEFMRLILNNDHTLEGLVKVKFDNNYQHWLNNHTSDNPDLNATWYVEIPSIGILYDYSVTGIVRAVAYGNARNGTNLHQSGLHYKRTGNGEHFPWLNESGIMSTSGSRYLCTVEAQCGYVYGSVIDKINIIGVR